MDEREIQLELAKLQKTLEYKIDKERFDVSNSLQQIKSYVETNLQKSFNTLEEFSVTLKSNLFGDKLIHEKLSELLRFKQDSDDNQFNLSNKVSSMQSHFQTSIKKFENFLFKNEEVIGLIGEHYKYKSYGEYLLVC